MNKQQFFSSITADIKADEEFFKKIYGYSFYDASFLEQVAEQLDSVNRKDAIAAYNNWFQQYQKERDAVLKQVSKDVVKNLDNRYEREVKKEIARNKQQQRFFTGFNDIS